MTEVSELLVEARELGRKVMNEPADLDGFVSELEQLGDALPSRINADPEKVEQGLAKLVLTLVELLRRLMERQACGGWKVALSWMRRSSDWARLSCGWTSGWRISRRPSDWKMRNST